MAIKPHNAFLPLLRFNLRVGGRLAFMRLGPVLAAFLFAFYLLRAEFFFLIVSELDRSGGAVLGTASAFICWMFARWAAPRILLGQTGWVRCLPASESAKRRAALAGLWVSLGPVLVVMGFLYVLSNPEAGGGRFAYLAGLPVLGWAGGISALALENGRLIRPAAFLAAALSASGDWPFLGAGLGLAAGVELLSGAMVKPGPKRFSLAPLKNRGLHFQILWRALGWRLAAAYLAAAPAFSLTVAFLLNNTVTSLQASRARMFGFAMALVTFHAVAAAMMASRRPAWPWLRSLPASARRRVLADAAFLGLASIVFLPPLALADVGSFAAVAASLPALSLGAAASLRQAPLRRTSALGVILLCGSLGALVLTLFPPVCAAFAAACPFFLSAGARLERSRKVSRWLELHHLAAGDPHSWSAK
jgi:hypothetical protein